MMAQSATLWQWRGVRAWQLAALAAALVLLGLGALRALAVAPATPEFRRAWERTDLPVVADQVDRTWMWGPDAFVGAIDEEYEESSGGRRLVQYYDKSRMEINNENADPSSLWYVTNGLLVVELVSGMIQVGDDAFTPHAVGPSNENVAGDRDDTLGPTYSTFSTLLDAAPLAGGAAITQRVARDGTIVNDPSLLSQGVTAAERVTVPGLDHQIASVFWNFMNSTGVVYEDGQYVTDNLFENPFYATGYPITEAYWSNVKVRNVRQDVLMQCFERRCLTYTPDNEPGWRVEAGNVGQHYYRWRYENNEIPTPTATATHTPAPTPTATPVLLPAERLFVATLSGDQEVPPVRTGASGAAWLFVDEGGAAIRYQVVVEGIEDVSAAHIHLGEPGENGDVVAPLFTAAGGATVSPDGVLVEGEITNADLPDDLTIVDLARAMVAGDLYVNVHTTNYPDGEIRGQIGVLGDVLFNAELNGVNMSPDVDTNATGRAYYFYDADAARIDFQLVVENLSRITTAHIHQGDANDDGPFLAMLFGASSPIPVPVNGVLGEGSLTINDLQDVTIEELVFLMLTGEAYADVHTTTHPDGEIRGQIEIGAGLDPQTPMTFVANLSGPNLDPPVETQATGDAVVILEPDGSLRYIIIAAGLVDATAAHIHAGAAGEEGVVLTTLFQAPAGAPASVNGVLAEGTIDAGDSRLPATLFAMLTASVYVDVHTEGRLDAELQGQLTPADGDVFLAMLAADQVVPVDPTVPVESDASGVALFQASADGESIDYILIVEGLQSATKAQIHVGEAGVNDFAVATIFIAQVDVPAPESGALAEGTLTADSVPGTLSIAGLLAKMTDGDAYVDAHTEAYPDGEIRGQIGPVS